MRHAALWVALLAVLLYAPGLGGGLVYDDIPFLLNNHWLAQGTFLGAFATNFWPLRAENWRSVNYRPLGMWGHLALYRLFGISPFAFHAASILLHVAACVSLFFLMKRLGFSQDVATVAAALFAVHPLHVEPVAWMTQLTEVMAGAGVLGSLALFVWNRRALSLVVAAAAMLSKEAALTLPAMIALVAYVPQRQKLINALRAAVPYAALAVAVVAARLLLLPRFPWKSLELGSSATAEIVLVTAAHYLRALFLPWPLAVHYQLPLTGDFVVAGAVAISWLWLALRSSLKSELRLAAGLTFLPLLFPLSASPQLPSFLRFQDRYCYIAVAGVSLAVALLLARLPRKAFVFAGLVLVTAGAAASLRQERVWQSDEALWTHTLEVTPASKGAAISLGYDLYIEQRFDEAAAVYRGALLSHPNDPELREFLSRVERK